MKFEKKQSFSLSSASSKTASDPWGDPVSAKESFAQKAQKCNFWCKKIAPINSISITKALKGTNEFGEIQVSLSELE